MYLLYLLPFTFLIPLFVFFVLVIRGNHLIDRQIFKFANISLVVSLVLAIGSVYGYISDYASDTYTEVVQITMWSWLRIGEFQPVFGLVFDGLAMTMMLVLAIGLIIQLFIYWQINIAGKHNDRTKIKQSMSANTKRKGHKNIKQRNQFINTSTNQEIQKISRTQSFRKKTGLSKFLAYLNLSIASMLILVLADNLILLYLGWELLTIATCLLINLRYEFGQKRWHESVRLNQITIKTVVITHIGNFALLAGLVMLYKKFDSINIHQILQTVSSVYPVADLQLNMIMLLIALGAIAKSAQLPLHSWLTGAASWTSPVSAMIQTVTMISAGVYLLARLHPLFVLTPYVLFWCVGMVGMLTMILCAVCAVAQTDIKKIITYSTMSQLGLIFLAMGVGAWQAGLYHLFTHTIYKSLIILACGALLMGVSYQQNISRLGGLRQKMPLVFWSFFISCASLMALPLTASFHSVNLILEALKLSDHSWLYVIAILGLFLTSIYTCRLLIFVFFGRENTKANYLEGTLYQKPIALLLILSTTLGSFVLSILLTPLSFTLPSSLAVAWTQAGLIDHSVQISASLFGVVITLIFYKYKRAKLARQFIRSRFGSHIYKWAYQGMGFDNFYQKVIIKPLIVIGILK